MASNLSREKLLFYAAAGGLGGLGAWGAAEPFLGIRFVYARDLLLGALIGFFIGAFLACIEAMSVGQWRQAARGIRSGGVIGAFGGAIGLLVGELLKRGWLMVVRSQSRNAREGREYPLSKAVTIIGRAEECDIGLFGDKTVQGHHAIIRQEGRNYFISATGGGQVLVNRQPVGGRHPLKSGDRVEIGGTLFLFRERAQVAQP